MAKKVKKRIKPTPLFVAKEVALGALGVASVGLVMLELFGHLSEQQVNDVAHVDFAIALLFLTDIIVSFARSKNRRQYIKHNWYFLLASIPLTDAVTGILRGLRVLNLIRLLQAAGHLEFDWQESRRGN